MLGNNLFLDDEDGVVYNKAVLNNLLTLKKKGITGWRSNSGADIQYNVPFSSLDEELGDSIIDLLCNFDYIITCVWQVKEKNDTANLKSLWRAFNDSDNYSYNLRNEKHSVKYRAATRDEIEIIKNTIKEVINPDEAISEFVLEAVEALFTTGVSAYAYKYTDTILRVVDYLLYKSPIDCVLTGGIEGSYCTRGPVLKLSIWQYN